MTRYRFATLCLALAVATTAAASRPVLANGPGEAPDAPEAADLQRLVRRLGPSPLILAARDGHLAQAHALIARGADVDARQRGNGMTALMYAANQGYVGIARLLLDAGADASIRAPGGITALGFAAANGKIGVVELLLRRTRPTAEELQHALINAARTGRPRTCRTLIEAGARVGSAGQDGFSPLALAARNGHARTVAMLIRLGADVDERGPRDRTALMWAGRAGHDGVVDVLLDAGADPLLRDASGEAAFRGARDREAITALMKRHRGNIRVRPEMCERLVGSATVWAQGRTTRTASYGLFRRPAAASTAWIVNHEPAPARRSRVTTIKRAEGSDAGWDVEFVPEAAPGPKRQRRATAIWDNGAAAPRTVATRSRDLPWGVTAETLNAAIDVTGDGVPDVLSIEFCCRDTTTREGCDYHCGEHWSREPDGWVKCDAWRPE